MAKKQTRRTVSLERRLYEAIQSRVEALGTSAAEYISKLVRDEMLSCGIEPPGFKHAKKWADYDQAPIPDRLNHVAPIKHTFGPPAIIAAPLLTHTTGTVDSKYAQALEFTRARLQAGLPVKPRTGCWWCHEEFRQGEIPSEYKDKRIHGRCKREIARLPEGAAIPA